VLEDLVAVGGASRLAVEIPAPRRTAIRVESGGHHFAADLYIPASGTRAGLVLVPGLAAAGKDDRRLVALAHTLGRVGFEVLVPDVSGFRSLRLRARDVTVIEDAILHLSALPETRGRPVGVGAFSFAVGPALVAALSPSLRDRVDFVLGVGGYHDLGALIAFYTVDPRRDASRGEEPPALIPHERGKWILALGLAEQLPQGRDRWALERLARSHLQTSQGDTVTPAMSGLGPDGAAVLALLENTDPARVPLLLSRLPEAIRRELAELNPADQDLARLGAVLILVHGRDDNIIPYTESLALAEAAPEGRAQLFLLNGLAHVDLSPTSSDVAVALEAIEALLAQRGPASPRAKFQ
jgi:fermentation-respiration switch protein FrsA (DUF1100 family)